MENLKVPKSISHWLDPFIIVAIIVAVYAALRASHLNDLLLSIVMVVAITAVMSTIELLRAPWSPFKLYKRPVSETFERSLKETSLQWLGMLAYFSILLFAWWALAEYSRTYYAPFFGMLPLLMLVGPLISAGVLFLSELLCGPYERGGKELGLLISRSVSGKFRSAYANARWTIIRDELLSWLLYGFFLPINFVELVKTLGAVRGQEALLFSGDWVQTQAYIIMVIYGMLIAAITPGYLFGTRLIRTETRNVDRTWFGWTITLICYDPIVTAVFGRWLDYRTAVEGDIWVRPWAVAFADVPLLLFAVGGFIVFCEIIHLWGEAQFGLRASNISNRGVITTGLFRLTKHPIFVAKCVGWFFIWVPFMAGGDLITDLRFTILWGFVCVIYVLRAVAEERVMAKDPDYVAYGLYMDKHGMFAWVGKMIPAMSFEYRLKRWQAIERAEAIESGKQPAIILPA